MDKKTKHRILGILVIVGLVVILLPFFQGKNELSSETAMIKAPPFPEQTIQVESSQTEASATQENVIPVQQNGMPLPQKLADNGVNEQPDDTITNTHTNVVAISVPAEHKTAQEVLIPSDPEPKQVKTSEPVVTQPVISKPVHVAKETPKKQTIPLISTHRQDIKVVSASVFATPINDNGLFALKNAVWVIQLGSFKNKANALRLVNQLRANGYPAFIQKVVTTFGESTRVYVGPATKRKIAHMLASKIENEMHLRGVVISYKPLTL